MDVVIILVFVVGYLAIALEHPIKINKPEALVSVDQFNNRHGAQKEE